MVLKLEPIRREDDTKLPKTYCSKIKKKIKAIPLNFKTYEIHSIKMFNLLRLETHNGNNANKTVKQFILHCDLSSLALIPSSYTHDGLQGSDRDINTAVNIT